MSLRVIRAKIFTKRTVSLFFVCHYFILQTVVRFHQAKFCKTKFPCYNLSMKTKKLVLFSVCSLLVVVLAHPAWAEVDDQSDSVSSDEELQNYDAIVKDLSKAPAQAKSRAKAPASSSESFENTTIHAGVAYASVFQTLDTPKEKIYVGQQGVQVSLGIDLFSEHLSSEGTLVTFGDQSYSKSSVAVREFDLMFYGKGILAPNIRGKIGGGIGARYLTLTQSGTSTQYSTPSSILSAGADYYFANAFSLGGELAMRNAMTGETIDERSYTMLIRLDSHF